MRFCTPNIPLDGRLRCVVYQNLVIKSIIWDANLANCVIFVGRKFEFFFPNERACRMCSSNGILDERAKFYIILKRKNTEVFMQVFLNIVKIIVGIILLNVAPLVTEEFTIGALIMYAAGAMLIILGVITIFRVIIDAVKGNSSGGSRGRGSSSSRYSSSSSSNSDGQSKMPGFDVGRMIADEVTSALYSIAPLSRLYCNVRHGDTAYLGGTISLSHRSDSGKVRGLIVNGFNAAMRRAASQGYDVAGMTLCSDDISVEIADNN